MNLPPCDHDKCPPTGCLRPAARVSVRLSVDDWVALAGFVTGDLHNMEDSDISRQMTRIVEAIHRAVAKSP